MARFIRPIALRLPDEEIERHATWLEIFFDLIFAVIVVQLSDRLSNNFTRIGTLSMRCFVHSFHMDTGQATLYLQHVLIIMMYFIGQ